MSGQAVAETIDSHFERTKHASYQASLEVDGPGRITCRTCGERPALTPQSLDAPRGSDAKPRRGAPDSSYRGGPYYRRWAVRRAVYLRTASASTGQLVLADRSASGRTTGVVFGVGGVQGGMSGDPAAIVAHRIRAALRPPDPARRSSAVVVMDAEGRALATAAFGDRRSLRSARHVRAWEEEFP